MSKKKVPKIRYHIEGLYKGVDKNKNIRYYLKSEDGYKNSYELDKIVIFRCTLKERRQQLRIYTEHNNNIDSSRAISPPYLKVISDNKLARDSKYSTFLIDTVPIAKVERFLACNDEEVINDFFENCKSRRVSPHDYLCIYMSNEFEETLDGHYTKCYTIPNETYYYEGTDIEGDPISCWGYYSNFRCNNCDTLNHEDEEHHHYQDNKICQSCYEDNYFYCESCEDVCSYDYGRNYDDYTYCESCYERLSPEDLYEYDWTPEEFNFFDYNHRTSTGIYSTSETAKLSPFFGLELEVESRAITKDKFADIVEEISNYGQYYNKYFYCKKDGSLSNMGFEICSMPMTFNAWKEFDLHDAIFKHRKYIKSYETNNCGIHIHINRKAFTEHHLFKFISFIHEFKGFIYLISQRKAVSELNGYSKFNNGFKDRVKRTMVKNIKAIKRDNAKIYKSTTIFGDKYVPVNLRHSNSVEVRIFKGNLREQSFRKNIEFLDSLYYFTKDNPLYKLKLDRYLGYVDNSRKQYNNLVGFLNANEQRMKEVKEFPLSVPEGLEY